MGDFEEENYPDRLEKVAPEPVSSVDLEEWKAYQEELAGAQEKTGATGNAELAQMKERHRSERKKVLSRLAKYGLPVLNIARHCLMAQQRAERFSLRSGRKKRGAASRALKTGYGHEDWRRRRRTGGIGLHGKKKDTPHRQRKDLKGGAETMWKIIEFRKYAVAVNADRYRVTCIKMDEDGCKKTFILDKKGGMTRGFSPDELEAHMPEMLRFQKRGENIY